MTMSGRSSHPALSRADGFAASSSQTLLLVGRILLGWLFFVSGYGKLGNIPGTVQYFTALKMPVPEFWAWFAGFGELIIGALLILGLATRYVALVTILWTAIATALAHRYWEYSGPAQIGQYNNFLKNLSIIGGLLVLFVTGPGTISVDSRMK